MTLLILGPQFHVRRRQGEPLCVGEKWGALAFSVFKYVMGRSMGGVLSMALTSPQSPQRERPQPPRSVLCASVPSSSWELPTASELEGPRARP